MLSLRIALRYLFAKKSHKAVNVISVIAMAGVAVAAMAIVVVLSVFNGFTDIAGSHLALVDPDIRITPRSGKVFGGADSLVQALESRSDVVAATASLTERALLVVDGKTQMPVVMKGVDHERAARVVDFDNVIIDGVFVPDNGLPDSCAAIQTAVGVAINTGIRPSPYAVAHIYVPRRTGRINPANPAAAYCSLPVAVTGVVQVDQPEYDADYIFVPLRHVRELLGYDGSEASAIELRLARDASVDKVKNDLQRCLPDYVVENRMEQQADTFRMISVEKWVTFLMLAFILVIAAFNIISTLSLLVIEKRSDMSTFRAMGASSLSVRNIFVAEGWLITLAGGVAGIIAGLLLALAQQHFGIIKLAADPAALAVDVYPVRVAAGDIAAVAAAVVFTGLIIGAVSRLFTRNLNSV